MVSFNCLLCVSTICKYMKTLSKVLNSCRGLICSPFSENTKLYLFKVTLGDIFHCTSESLYQVLLKINSWSSSSSRSKMYVKTSPASKSKFFPWSSRRNHSNSLFKKNTCLGVLPPSLRISVFTDDVVTEGKVSNASLRISILPTRFPLCCVMLGTDYIVV